jgi:hypothetical protein
MGAKTECQRPKTERQVPDAEPVTPQDGPAGRGVINYAKQTQFAAFFG